MCFDGDRSVVFWLPSGGVGCGSGVVGDEGAP
nr:MAG TPA: hypothetical protein [Caudoviricetes sp.]